MSAVTGKESPVPASMPEADDFGLPPDLVGKIRSLQRPSGHVTPGAKAITGEACAAGVLFLEYITSFNPLQSALPVGVTPSVQGAVSLYWEHSGHRLMVQIPSLDRKGAYFQYASPDRQVERGTSTWEDLVSRLLHIYRAG